MKSLYLMIIASLMLACQPKASQESSEKSKAENKHTPFDSLLAVETGADAYGMRSYIFANLIADPNRDQDSLEAVQLQRAHLDNISRLAEEGKLVLAGPFMDSKEVRGIYIFAVATIEEAEQLTKSDPAIQAGRLQMELRPWYGSAALMKINELHEQIARQGI